MDNILITHTADAIKSRDTGVLHATDTFKSKSAIIFHGTDARTWSNNLLIHGTSSNKFKLTLAAHGADSFKRVGVTETDIQQATGVGVLGATFANDGSGTVLGGHIRLPSNPDAKPELSKNSSTYIEIGGGLSVMVGLPRIATWNTNGRPKKPEVGTLGFNTEIQSLEMWDGIAWYVVAMDPLVD